MKWKKQLGRRLGCALLSTLLVLGLFAGGGFRVRALLNETVTDVGEFNSKLAAVIAAGGGTLTLDLGSGRHELPHQNLITATEANTTVTIRSQSAAPVTLYAPVSRHLNLDFNASVTLTLIFENVILDGACTSGGIDMALAAGDFILDGAVIQNCVSGGPGGALYRSASGATTILNSQLRGNRTTAGSMWGSNGGAISLPYGPVAIRNSVFEGNQASGARGGALEIFNNTASGGVIIEDSTFDKNTAGTEGGAIYITISSQPVTVTDSTFSGNTANGDGGAIHTSDTGALSFSGSTSFSGNMASKGYEPDASDVISAWIGIPNSGPFSHIRNNYDVVYTTGSNPPDYALLFYRNDSAIDTLYHTIQLRGVLDFTGLFPFDPVRAGYRFAGWNTSTDGSGQVVDETTTGLLPPSANIVLYAQWDPVFTVDFDTGGGSTVPSQTVPPNDTVTRPPDPTRPGYIFTGWFSDPGRTTPYVFSDPVTADLTLYAGWRTGGGGGPYTVRFYTGGGSAVDPQTVDRNGRVQKPADPTRPGYVFTGWFTDAACTLEYDFDRVVTGAFALFAGWAEAPGTLVKPYISGYPDGTFRPGKNISRAEAAELLFSLADNGILPPAGAPGAANTFTDVPAGSWYYDAVTTLADAGIVFGYGDGSFHPDGTITRAEFVVMLVRYAGLAPENVSGFPDVSPSHWAAGSIAAAEAAGLIAGYPDGSFRPGGRLNRAEAVTAINRLLGRSTDSALFEGIDNPFTDVPQTHWAWGQIMAAAVEHPAQ